MTVTDPSPPPMSPDALPSRRMRIPKRPNPIAATCKTVGDIGWFALAVLKQMPAAIGLYPSEVLRQAAVLVRSSALIIWFMMWIIGTEIGLQGHYVLGQVGADGYVGVFVAVGSLKATSATMWGWVLSAKVGCGYVAEIGSMRISDEVDALEVMGVHSRAYLVGTRLWAMWITAPFLFVTGVGFQFFGAWLTAEPMLQSTSPGQYADVVWSFQTPIDLLAALTWAIFLGSIVVIVGCFYGYTSSGGPVGVGLSTAKSMVVNMIIVSACAVILYQFFFGTNIGTPIAN
jgi:phospholipid/cholesterol/gamma-HCH transport system permease protein